MVWDKDGNFLYGVQYKGSVVQSSNGGYDFYVIPIVSSPGNLAERQKPILLKPNVE